MADEVFAEERPWHDGFYCALNFTPATSPFIKPKARPCSTVEIGELTLSLYRDRDSYCALARLPDGAIVAYAAAQRLPIVEFGARRELWRLRSRSFQEFRHIIEWVEESGRWREGVDLVDVSVVEVQAPYRGRGLAKRLVTELLDMVAKDLPPRGVIDVILDPHPLQFCIAPRRYLESEQWYVGEVAPGVVEAARLRLVSLWLNSFPFLARVPGQHGPQRREFLCGRIRRLRGARSQRSRNPGLSGGVRADRVNGH